MSLKGGRAEADLTLVISPTHAALAAVYGCAVYAVYKSTQSRG